MGMGHQLLDKEGRKPLADKDLKTITPVEPAAKEDGKGEGEAAPAPGGGGEAGDRGGDSGGGEAAPAGVDGGDGGGDDGGAGEGEEGPGADGEVKAATARPVSVANTTQCCGGLKSGVCTLI